MPIKNKFTIGAYFHEPLNNEGGGVVAPVFDELTGDLEKTVPNFYLPTEVRNNQAFVVGEPISKLECEARRREMNNPFTCLEFRIDPFVSALSVRQRTFGLAGAWQVHPKLSIGANVRHQRFQEGAFTFRFTQLLDPKQVLVQATAKANGETVELIEATDTTFGFGFKWSPTDKISVGGVYKQGPEFETSLFYADAASQFNLSEVAAELPHPGHRAGLGVSSARSRC